MDGVKAKEYLLACGWVYNEVAYNQFGHKTRVGWGHPAGIFKKAVSFEKAIDFQLKYEKMAHYIREQPYEN